MLLLSFDAVQLKDDILHVGAKHHLLLYSIWYPLFECLILKYCNMEKEFLLNYVSPSVEIIEVEVESGFQSSGEGSDVTNGAWE